MKHDFLTRIKTGMKETFKALELVVDENVVSWEEID
jgi:hypothetical protein